MCNKIVSLRSDKNDLMGDRLVESCNVLSWFDLVVSLEINDHVCSVSQLLSRTTKSVCTLSSRLERSQFIVLNSISKDILQAALCD